MSTPIQFKIAIVGIAAQLPSGHFSNVDLDYNTLWDFLASASDAYVPLTSEMFGAGTDALPANLPRSAALLKIFDTFDNLAFGISAKDARVMAPSARRLTQTAFQALEDSGIEYRGKRVGVYMSGGGGLAVDGSLNTLGAFSSVPSALPNRISYMLDLRGPSIQLDTACSSSLTGVHLAISALERGDCDTAVVGAAQIVRGLSEWQNYVLGGVLSPDGKTKPFDTAADGFGRGEGVCAVVLKPLGAALRDNDHIYSVISGSAINSTGSAMPLNVPSAVAQKDCIVNAFARAGREIGADYVELHITGTPRGDPIEANAAGEIFPEGTVVGSIKGNIGHLESAAFLASLLKVCHIVEKGIIPPVANLSSPAPSIAWDTHKLRVPTDSMVLSQSSPGISVVGLAGAGIGGSTGHIVVESAPPPSGGHVIAGNANTPVTFIVGGLSPRAVSSISQSILDAGILDFGTLRALAATLSRRARQMPWRTTFTLPTPAEIPAAIMVASSPPPLAFIFSGQGPQNLAMGRGLFASSPVFRSAILELDTVFTAVQGYSLLESTGLFLPISSTPPSMVLPATGWPVLVTVASIAMLQIGLFDLLVSLGVAPSCFAGHSAGETAILYASGAGSKAMALEVAIARGLAMTPTESSCVGMAAMACDAARAETIIQQILSGNADPNAKLEISCYNAPSSVTLSGSAALLDAAVGEARKQGLFSQRIRTMVPGHSSYMDVIQGDYMARMEDIWARYPGKHVPKIPVFSTCTDKTVVAEFTPTYFWNNCRNAVRFDSAVASILQSHPDSVFVEISCHPVLASSILAQPGVSEAGVLCPMTRQAAMPTEVEWDPELALLTTTLARLALLGYNGCDFTPIYGSSAFKPAWVSHPFVERSVLPPSSHTSRAKSHSGAIGASFSSSPLLGQVSELTHPLLAQHVINGEPILPATGFIEMLLEAGARHLWDVEFKSVFSLSARNTNTDRMTLEREGDSWSLRSAAGTSSSMKREYARGMSDNASPERVSRTVELEPIWERLPVVSMNGFYDSLKPFAAFGPAFRNVLRVHGGPTEVIAEIRANVSSDDDAPHEYDYLLNPATLDSCLHVVLHPAISKQYGTEGMYLPARLERFVYYGPSNKKGNWFSHIRRTSWSPVTKSYDITVTDSAGAIICELGGLIVNKLVARALPVGRRLDLIWQPISVPSVVTEGQSAYSTRKHQPDERPLFTILDALAVGVISRSLSNDKLAVADDISRQRYLAFARRAIQKPAGELVAPEVESAMRAKYAAHFELTERISSVHESVFVTSKAAVDHLFSDDLMPRFYSRESQTSTAYTEAVKAFSELLDSLYASGKRVINILEIGAGTGLLTRYIVDELKRHPDMLVEFTVTDTSYAFAAELARTLDYSKVTPKSYDLFKDPTEQGIHLESFDIVVALHVLHVATDIRSCLSSVQSLLVPGGSLVILEIDGTSWGDKAGSVWLDFIFGSFSEWFGFEDDRTHCTMSPSAWIAILHEVGFVNNHASIEPGDGGQNFFFTAQKPSGFNRALAASRIEPAHIHRYSFGDELRLQSALRALNPKDRVELYITALMGRDGDAAIGLCATLGRELPFWSVRLAVFASEVQLAVAAELLPRYRDFYQRGEPALFFPRDGSPCVSRASLSSSPAPVPYSDLLSLTDADKLIVEIIALESTPLAINAFVGRVVMSHRANPSVGDLVAGITDHAKGPLLTTLVDSVVCLDAARPRDLHALRNPQFLLHSVAVSFIRDCLPRRAVSLLVAVSDDTMADIFASGLKALGNVKVVRWDSTAAKQPPRVDVVLTDSITSDQHPHLRRWVSRAGCVLVWDTLLRDSLRDEALDVSSAFEARTDGMNGYGIQPAFPAASEPATHAALFRHDKSYVLVGGIGGLGIDLAIWMYQRGARHLVLTSRRGLASLDPERDAEALAKVAYLRSRADLVLRLEACDATDASVTCALFQRLPAPLAGVFQMTLVLSDALFLNQKLDNFTVVHDSKVKVFELVAAAIEIASLDFYVAFSSLAGLTGSPGQANYSSACTVLNGILADYPNAYSLIVPGILDAGYLDRADSLHVETNDSGIFGANVPVVRLWEYLEDGLRKLQDGSPTFNQYIPDLNFDALHAGLPLPAPFNHLLASHHPTASGVRAVSHASEDEILRVVLPLLEVEKADFDFDLPLLSYGLDSLSATRLSSALQPFLAVSQVQLLAGVSWSELRVGLPSGDVNSTSGEGNSGEQFELARAILLEILGVAEADFDPVVPLISYGLDSLSAAKLATALKPYLAVTQLQLLANTSWTDLHSAAMPGSNAHTLSLSADTIVEIRPGRGIPLIVFCGGEGSLAPLLALRNHYSDTLWGIQVTDSTPTATFSALSEFYTAKIREKRPQGPYRLAAYSQSCVVGVAVTKLLEAAGEQVQQLTFIDQFPGLWTSDVTEQQIREQSIPDLLDEPIVSMISMLRSDPLYSSGDRSAQLEAARVGSPKATQSDIETLQMTKRLVVPLLEFIVAFYPPDIPRSSSAFTDAFTRWFSAVKAPLSVLVAEFGTITTLPPALQSSWADLGASRCLASVEVHRIPGAGHYGILGDELTASLLQRLGQNA